MRQVPLPPRLSFRHQDIYDFETPLKALDWTPSEESIALDLTRIRSASDQGLSILVPYIWYLRCRGCKIRILTDKSESGASSMWRRMGAPGWSRVLFNPARNFKSTRSTPMVALRTQEDFSKALATAEEFAKSFDVEYEKTLRYVVSELLYNALEHGAAACATDNDVRIPPIIQFSWYKEKKELHFVVADLGVGIRSHLEQTYPSFGDDAEAIRKALEPQVSGTFGVRDPYGAKNNAGMGLFISSSIVRRVRADMHIVSGSGLVHISPRDVTSKTLSASWPGTFVHVAVHLGAIPDINLHRMMTEARENARREIDVASNRESEDRFPVHIRNFFGPYAEDKFAAARYRDRHLLPAVEAGKIILLDFDGVVSAPHSFLSALLATPVQRTGLLAYKRFKVVNASPELRETIDYILDENTVGGFGGRA